ncbi:PA2169 family four-helix-bundle protein [Pedobacter sp. SYSU D00535]|uniref:ferritin-like domain-containing protein n=1 Tax=Pedobacter sp. SYSU D00535 TaxID=2810308 RepID=UPI001A96C0DA|nr:PA2169 family four-helix-bundle protein [Pedobacter sp. SYSU D00535]
MENSNEKIQDGLKHLLHIANDGKEGYKNAAENCESAELKALFTTYSIQRSEFEMELKSCLHKFGSNSDNEKGGPLGAIHRTWIDIKSSIMPNENKAVLDACITGEKSAIETYDKVLEDTSLPSDVRDIVMSQRQSIAECLHNIQNLENQYATS